MSHTQTLKCNHIVHIIYITYTVRQICGVLCIACNSDAMASFVIISLTFTIFLLLCYYQMMPIIPLPKMTTNVTTATQIFSKSFIKLLSFGLISSLTYLKRTHWFAYCMDFHRDVMEISTSFCQDSLYK